MKKMALFTLTQSSRSISIIYLLLSASYASAFLGTTSTQSSGRSLLPLGSTSATSSNAISSVSSDKAIEGGSDSKCWASHALLISSLSDGIIPNEAARSFLRYSLVNTLLREHIAKKEDNLKSSVEFSPCNGPNIDALTNLESVDQVYERGQQFSADDFDANVQSVDSWAMDALEHLISDTNCNSNVRVLYIPTAMYALNPKSSNTPGKQRQRARADGKKRRTQLLKLLGELLPSSDEMQFNLLATTLDLDDGSLKQPVGSEDSTLFPENDKAALSTWNPHLVYIEGGNTFWLKHCIDKGDYASIIKEAVCEGPIAAVYCGKSAGAIVAGSKIATATWKGWDDPSVVPEKETYEDWLDCTGFEFSGSRSFFPHMSNDWKELVEEKIKSQNLGEGVCCLREEDAYCVIGEKKVSFMASGPSPIN